MPDVVMMFSASSVSTSVLAGLAHPALRERVESGKWLLSESSKGVLRIRLDSLINSLDSTTKERIRKGE